MERHELKFRITPEDACILRSRLRAVMQRDCYTGPDGSYQVRSLYFDDWQDSALTAKLYGINKREKFRLRFYNGDTSFIRLEKKSKYNNLSKKTSVILTSKQVQALLYGNIQWMEQADDVFLHECAHKFPALRPKVIVEYKREAYTFTAGNVRITIDSDIRTGIYHQSFLSASPPMVPVTDNPYLLEIKYDRFLPEIIQCIIQLERADIGTFSKYAAARCFD